MLDALARPAVPPGGPPTAAPTAAPAPSHPHGGPTAPSSAAPPPPDPPLPSHTASFAAAPSSPREATVGPPPPPSQAPLPSAHSLAVSPPLGGPSLGEPSGPSPTPTQERAGGAAEGEAETGAPPPPAAAAAPRETLGEALAGAARVTSGNDAYNPEEAHAVAMAALLSGCAAAKVPTKLQRGLHRFLTGVIAAYQSDSGAGDHPRADARLVGMEAARHLSLTTASKTALSSSAPHGGAPGSAHSSASGGPDAAPGPPPPATGTALTLGDSLTEGNSPRALSAAGSVDAGRSGR